MAVAKTSGGGAMLPLWVGGVTRRVEPRAVVAAGFTGRDPEEVAAHVNELAAEGVPAPASVPAFYRLDPWCLVQADEIDVAHGETSGEAEITLVRDGEEWLVTLASDHTDRRAEALDIATAKRLCPKVVATDAWRYEDVAGRWDSLELVSWIEDEGRRVLYQRGTADALLAPDDLLARLPRDLSIAGLVLLTGTIPAQDGLRAAPMFWAELNDRETGRSIELCYRVSHASEAP